MSTRDKMLERWAPVDDPVIMARREMMILTLLQSSSLVREQYQLDERLIDSRLEGFRTGRLLGEHEGRLHGFEEGHAKGYREGESSGEWEGKLIEARASLRSVLSCRSLALTQDDEARIDACRELRKLQCWLRQSVTAASAAEALA